MDPLNSYVFDTTGCLILKGLLSEKDINEARQLIQNNWPSGAPWKFPVMHLGRVFWRMLTNQVLLDFCDEFCGEHFRLDHAFGLSSNGAIAQLHGGPQSSQYSCFFLQLHSGPRKAIVGQLNFGYCLHGQSQQTGGFAYIPGSHKSNEHRAGREILEEFYKGDFSHHSIIVPTLEPGDMIIFTESLIHGDTGWKTSGNRMQIYFKMTPGFMCWRDPQEIEVLNKFSETPLEKRIIEPPWTGRYYEDHTSMGTSNHRRRPTI